MIPWKWKTHTKLSTTKFTTNSALRQTITKLTSVSTHLYYLQRFVLFCFWRKRLKYETEYSMFWCRKVWKKSNRPSTLNKLKLFFSVRSFWFDLVFNEQKYLDEVTLGLIQVQQNEIVFSSSTFNLQKPGEIFTFSIWKREKSFLSWSGLVSEILSLFCFKIELHSGRVRRTWR